MAMAEIDSCLVPFMPTNGRLVELTARFFLAANPDDQQNNAWVAYESSVYVAIQCHRILSGIAARADEEGLVIATRQGLERNFAKACFTNIAFMLEDLDEASRLLHCELQRLAMVPKLPMNHGTLEQMRDGTIRVMPHQPK